MEEHFEARCSDVGTSLGQEVAAARNEVHVQIPRMLLRTGEIGAGHVEVFGPEHEPRAAKAVAPLTIAARRSG